jgi:hypothetical protein
MPKPMLREPFASLEADLIETMIGGLHEYRGDLSYPESHSDMAGCIRAVLRKYDLKLRAVVLDREEIEAPEPMCPVCGKSTNGGRLTTLTRPPGDPKILWFAHQTCVVRNEQ